MKAENFFKVEAYRTKNTISREVEKGWDQPFLTQVGYDGGILGLVRKRFDDVPHYLVEGKFEPVELQPNPNYYNCASH